MLNNYTRHRVARRLAIVLLTLGGVSWLAAFVTAALYWIGVAL